MASDLEHSNALLLVCGVLMMDVEKDGVTDYLSAGSL